MQATMMQARSARVAAVRSHVASRAPAVRVRALFGSANKQTGSFFDFEVRTLGLRASGWNSHRDL
jgi:hypothetical protein